jgi:protein-S-isoprenylcysteine O-methyltransferase Ste14
MDRHRVPRALREAAPRALFVLGLALLAGALIRQVRHLDEPLHVVSAALVAGYLAWLLAEVPVTFRRSATPPAESRTLLAYALARLGLAVSGAVVAPPWTAWSAWLAVPAVVFVGGIAFRQVAIRTLGRFYSHHVVRQREHAVVANGLYRFVRHPAYTGMLTANAGYVAFFLNPLSAGFLALLTAAVVWRIRVEERVLASVPGYAGYAEGRARLCPGVW